MFLLTISPFTPHDWRLLGPTHDLIIRPSLGATPWWPWPCSGFRLLCYSRLAFELFPRVKLWHELILLLLEFFLEPHPQLLVHKLELFGLLLGFSLPTFSCWAKFFVRFAELPEFLNACWNSAKHLKGLLGRSTFDYWVSSCHNIQDIALVIITRWFKSLHYF